MKISFLIFISVTVACAQKPSSSIASVKQSVQDLNNFCMGKTLDFCSKEHMEIAMNFLIKQQDQLMKNLEKELREAKKAENKRRRNRMTNNLMIHKFRQHFLDRHL
jgi:hypothetical protein